jgi:hypothetical protein
VQITHGQQVFSSTGNIAQVADAPINVLGSTIHPTAGAPFSGRIASFTDGNPAATVGELTATIKWGDGTSSQGTIQANGQGGFDVLGSHTYLAAGTYTVQVLVTDAGGCTASSSNQAVAANLGLRIERGQTAPVSFWGSKAGLTLIGSFNGGPNSTALGNWLAATLPNLFGASAASHDLTGKTNSQVATFFQKLYHTWRDRLEAELLATALNVYATTRSLGGTAAQKYGFTVTSNGLGAYSYNVGCHGAALGVPNGKTLNVMQILKAADARAVHGVLDGREPRLQRQALDLFEDINHEGAIKKPHFFAS